MEQIINKMAEAIYNAQYASQGGKWYAVETKDVWEDIAKEALAAIQEDYVLVRKEAVEIEERIDAAMLEMTNIHPPIRRSECKRLIIAALEINKKDITR